MTVKSEKKPSFDEVMGRVAQATQSLLKRGAEPFRGCVRFDHSRRRYGPAGRRRSVEGLSIAARCDRRRGKARLQMKAKNRGLELTDQEPSEGTTIH